MFNLIDKLFGDCGIVFFFFYIVSYCYLVRVVGCYCYVSIVLVFGVVIVDRVKYGLMMVFLCDD